MQLIDILTYMEKEIGKRVLFNDTFKFTPISYTNADKAQSLLVQNINRFKADINTNIKIFFDIDFDGIASGYIFWKMLTEICQCNPQRIIPIINKERKHSITEDVLDNINNDQNTILTIIVDSSTNEIDTYTKLNTDLIIIDHHDVEINHSQLSGQTAGGQYCIVNNMIDNIDAKSAAEVVYEFWYNIAPYILLNLKLEEWVAVSLYSDVIDIFIEQNLWFTNYLRNLRPDADILKILNPLDCVDIRTGHMALTKSSINFKLVPLINSSMRMQAGLDLVMCILYRPNTIASFKSCVKQQKEIVNALMTTMSPEVYGDIQIAELKQQVQKKPASLIGFMQTAEMSKKLNTYSQSVIDGFKGLIAGKFADKQKMTTFVYGKELINNELYLKGSVRTKGRYANINLRSLLAIQPDWTASGHGNAFGFSYKLDNNKNTQTMAYEVLNLLANVRHTNQRQTAFLLADYNLLYHLTCIHNEDTLNQIRIITEINNLKTLDDQYAFDIRPSGGFVEPIHYQESARTHSFTWSGQGPLRIQLMAYDGTAKLEIGQTYRINLNSIDGNCLLGDISCISSA